MRSIRDVERSVPMQPEVERPRRMSEPFSQSPTGTWTHCGLVASSVSASERGDLANLLDDAVGVGDDDVADDIGGLPCLDPQSPAQLRRLDDRPSSASRPSRRR